MHTQKFQNASSDTINRSNAYLIQPFRCDKWFCFLIDTCCWIQGPQDLCVCVAAAAITLSPEEARPWICGAYLSCMVSILAMLPPGQQDIKRLSVCTNDYASKMRIDILCKQTCCTAPYHASKIDLLGDSRNYGTLARMSTLTLKGSTGGTLVATGRRLGNLTLNLLGIWDGPLEGDLGVWG
jgi:hypothetical protein